MGLDLPCRLREGSGVGTGAFRDRDTERARAQRDAATPAERTLWTVLSSRKLADAKFGRQMPVGPYFADFLSRELKLIVEVGGRSHDVGEERDRERDAFLAAEGYHVLRFTDDEVTASIEGVAAVIALEIETLRRNRPRPLPQAEGRTKAASSRSSLAKGEPAPLPPEGGHGSEPAGGGTSVPDPATDAAGHRERLRRRLFEGGGEALLDHELVEYLLGLAIRRGDTKPLARRLLAEFGSYGALVGADPASLANAGLGETTVAVLKIAQASALRMLARQVEGRPVLASWQALSDYLHASMAHRMNEAARVLHLNTKNMLIRDETMSEGSIDQAAIYVREVVRRALELGSAAIILVHNHPSGDPAPSRQDIALTRELIQALKPLGIGVHDHIIVGAQGQASLRSMGLI